MKKNLFFFTLLLWVIQVEGQPIVRNVDQLLSNGNQRQAKQTTSGFFQIEAKDGLTADQFMQSKKWELSEDPKVDFVKLNTQKSKYGWAHTRYQQTYGGIPVEGQQLIVHERNGELLNVNGALVARLSINIIPDLTEKRTFSQALNSVNAIKYVWEEPAMQKELQYSKNDPAATLLPKGKLVIVSASHAPFLSGNEYSLAWRFDISSLVPHDHVAVYVDAHTGEVLRKHSLMRHSQGTGETNYNGVQSFTCAQSQFGYQLKNNSVKTKRSNGQEIISPSLDWENEKSALDVHWGIEQFVEYLDLTFDRDAYDNQGSTINARIGWPGYQNNAVWDSGKLWFGTGDGTSRSSMTSLDIVAHEYTHAMLENMVNFTYWGESGAIEEGYSDIFGELLENRVKGSPDWKVGGEITLENGQPNNEGIRDLSDPRQYMDNFWINADGASDNGGVHTKSRVFSYWFYLLATDNLVGIDSAENLIYQTLGYLTSSPDYIDLMNATVDVAGTVSPMMRARVIAAWLAVGLDYYNTIALTVLEPTDGDVLYGGLEQTISWTSSSPIQSVVIEYSLNGGASWIDVDSFPNTGNYDWPIPEIISSSCKIRVSEKNAPQNRGLSFGLFEIKEKPNDPPTAANDFVTTISGASVSIDPTENDSDDKQLDVNFLELVSTSTPQGGGFSIVGNNQIEITVDSNFVGIFIVDYAVCDLGIPALCDTATISVNAAASASASRAVSDWAVQHLQETTSQNLLANEYQLGLTWNFSGWDTVSLTNGSISINALGDFVYNPISLGRDTIKYFVANNDTMILDTAYLYLFNVEEGASAKDSMDLIMLYEMTDGPNWSVNWDLSTPIDTWTGVTVYNNRVTKLDLWYKQLNGELADFQNLTMLEDLKLSLNNLNGNIPSLSKMTALRYLRLDNNQFSGRVPDFLMTNLVSLYLYNNQLSGNLPFFNNLVNLSYLYLQQNELTGFIPNFQNSNLIQINLHSNQLSGSIPNFNDASQSPNIDYINLRNNLLTGSVPAFPNLNLTYLYLNGNQLLFTGFEQHLPISGHQYGPQDSIPIFVVNDTLMVNPGGNINNNTYAWYHDDVEVAVSGASQFVAQESGYYYSKITNNPISDTIRNGTSLILFSKKIYVEPICNVASILADSISLCYAGLLDAGHTNMSSYLWMLNGDTLGTGQQLQVIETGDYILEMQDSCLTPVVRDTIVVVDFETNCIYPGDINYDGTVNHHDLKLIGFHFGTIGPARTDTSTAFIPVKCDNWEMTANATQDLKHIDTNGDGQINAKDTMAIIRNYGKTWGNYIPVISNAPSSLRIIPEIVSVSYNTNRTIEIKYTLENTEDSLLQFYGLFMDTKILSPVSTKGEISLDSSGINNQNEYLFLSEQADTNLVQTAFIKTDLVDEIVQDNRITIGGGNIIIEQDLPTNDTLTLVDISTENITLTTVSSNLDTGTYFIPVEGVNTSLFYSDTLAFTLSSTPSTCEEKGSITARVFHGIPPYTYRWSDGQTNSVATGLATGTYQVTIADNTGFNSTDFVQITPANIEATVGGFDEIQVVSALETPSNGQANGSIALTPFGGYGSQYHIRWSDGQTGAIATGLDAGTYVAIIENEGACAQGFEFYLASSIEIKVILEGTYNDSSGLMHDDLRFWGLLPYSDPYLGQKTTDSTTFDLTGYDAVVDWVLIELRDTVDYNRIVSIPALLQRDGDIVGVDGLTPPLVNNVRPDYYFVLIKHRNHLPVMSQHPVPLTGTNGLTHDFTLGNSYTNNGFGQVYYPIQGSWAMYGGNGEQTTVAALKDINGYDKIVWKNVFGDFNLYHSADFNMDATIDGGDHIFYSKNQGISSRIPFD